MQALFAKTLTSRIPLSRQASEGPSPFDSGFLESRHWVLIHIVVVVVVLFLGWLALGMEPTHGAYVFI